MIHWSAGLESQLPAASWRHAVCSGVWVPATCRPEFPALALVRTVTDHRKLNSVCVTHPHTLSLWRSKTKGGKAGQERLYYRSQFGCPNKPYPELTGALSVVIKRQSLGIWRSGRTLGGLATSFRIFSLSLYPFLSPSAGGAMLSRYLASSLPNSWQQLYVSQSGKRKAYLLVLQCPDALGCRNCKQPLAVKCPFEILAFIKEVYSPSDWVTIPVANEMIHKKLL